jgi:hypothetical protein
MAVRESILVGAIARAVHAHYPEAWIFKVAGGPYQVAGVPDLLVCIRGLMVGLEVKNQQPGETVEHARSRATPGQLVQIERITRAGGVAAVVVSVQEALDLLGRAVPDEQD